MIEVDIFYKELVTFVTVSIPIASNLDHSHVLLAVANCF